MSHISVHLPDAAVAELDIAASRLKCSRTEVIRQAIENYLEEFNDLSVGIKRLRDPSDPVLDWDQVRHKLLNTDREPERIAKPNRARIVEGIKRLADNPFLGNALKGELRGLRRLRVGDYRIIYEVQDDALLVLVIRIAHRREVHRRRTV